MKFYSLAAVTTLLALSVAACDENPSKGKTHASTSAPMTATAAPTSAVAYTFSEKSSKLEFVGAKVTRKHDGAFQRFSGTVNLVDNDPLKSSVTAQVDIASITTDTAKLTAHLQSPDLLDVGKFGKATFVSTSVAPSADKKASHTITGNLQLHGVTKSISFPATLSTSTDAVNVEAEFAINRKDFGIVYPGMPDDLIKDDVLLKLHIHARRGQG